MPGFRGRYSLERKRKDHLLVLWRCGWLMIRLTGNIRDRNLESLIYVHYTGVIGVTPGLELVLSGRPEAKTTAWGDACECVSFSSAC